MGLAIALIMLAVIAATAWTITVGATLAAGQLTAIVAAMLSAIAVTCLTATAVVGLDQRSGRFAKTARRIALRLQLTASAGLQLLALSLAATILAPLVGTSTSGATLGDAQFVALDQRLGFDWIAYLARLNMDAAFGNLLMTVHPFAPVLIAAPVLLLGLTYQRRRLAEFICGLTIASFAALLLFALLPTVGAYLHLRPDARLFAHLNPAAGQALAELLNAWSSAVTAVTAEPGTELDPATLRRIDLLNTSAALSLPGLQVAAAILVVTSLRRMLLSGVIAAGCCLLIVLSPMSEAGQYLSQLMFGGLIAVGCILLTQALRYKRQAPPAPVRRHLDRDTDYIAWEKPVR